VSSSSIAASSAKRATRVFFPNYHVILLPHGYKPNAMNSVLQFKVPRSMAKPQLFDYFRQVHNMKVAKINTLIQPARIKRDRATGKLSSSQSYKKCYVTLSEPEMISVPAPPKRLTPQQAPKQ
jgi:ribosomal protein L23